MTKAMSPNSLANLMPPWKAGKGSGSAPPSGAPENHGRAVIQWMNTMGSWPTERIKGVANDASAPTNKRLAAKSLVRSMSDDWAKNGKPHAMEDLNLQLDRTDGRAVQRVEVQRTAVADPSELRVRLMEALAQSPGLLESLRAAGVLPGGDAPAGGGGPQTDA